MATQADPRTTAPETRTEHDDVPALRKGLTVLDLLAAHGPMTTDDVQRASSLNRTMSYRLLRALSELGYVDYDPIRHRYDLGLRLLELGAAIASRLDLAVIGRPLLAEVWDETQETVNLGVLVEEKIVYIAMLESPRGLRMAARLGSRDAVHSTSLGKAMLAFLPSPDREALIARLAPLAALTSATITDPAALEQGLSRARERGYALDDEENEVGARCIGVPVLDGDGRPVAGISVSGPVGRIDPERADQIAARLWATSRELSRRLGYGASEAALQAERSR